MEMMRKCMKTSFFSMFFPAFKASSTSETCGSSMEMALRMEGLRRPTTGSWIPGSPHSRAPLKGLVALRGTRFMAYAAVYFAPHRRLWRWARFRLQGGLALKCGCSTGSPGVFIYMFFV